LNENSDVLTVTYVSSGALLRDASCYSRVFASQRSLSAFSCSSCSRSLTLVAELKELEYDHSQAYVLSSPLLPTVDSTILRVALAADIFWHLRNESMKPRCIQFQG
ncbi:hypothetical protein M405DRAFT_809207, partial [Rhizopogon salebrosus TDB-379]